MCMFCKCNNKCYVVIGLPNISRKDTDDHAYIYYNNSNNLPNSYIVGNRLFMDNSLQQFPMEVIPINYCPFCGRLLTVPPIDFDKECKPYYHNLPDKRIELAYWLKESGDDF